MNQGKLVPNENSWLIGEKFCCWERLKAEGEEGDRDGEGQGSSGMLQSVGHKESDTSCNWQQFLSSEH